MKIIFITLIALLLTKASFGFDSCSLYKIAFKKYHVKRIVKSLPIKIDSSWFIGRDKKPTSLYTSINNRLIRSFKYQNGVNMDTLLSQIDNNKLMVSNLTMCKFKILKDPSNEYSYSQVSKLFWLNKQVCFFQELDYYGGHGTSNFILFNIKNGKVVKIEKIIE